MLIINNIVGILRFSNTVCQTIQLVATFHRKRIFSKTISFFCCKKCISAKFTNVEQLFGNIVKIAKKTKPALKNIIIC